MPEFNSTFDSIAVAIDDNDRVKAEFLIHKIKGASGTISAVALFSSTRKLEENLRTNNLNAVISDLNDCRKELSTVLDSAKKLESLLVNHTLPTQTRENVSKEELSMVFGKLDKSLKRNSLTANGYVDEVKGMLESTGLKKELGQLEKTTRSFDFKETRSVLLLITKKMNISYLPT